MKGNCFCKTPFEDSYLRPSKLCEVMNHFSYHEVIAHVNFYCVTNSPISRCIDSHFQPNQQFWTEFSASSLHEKPIPTQKIIYTHPKPFFFFKLEMSAALGGALRPPPLHTHTTLNQSNFGKTCQKRLSNAKRSK